MCFIVSNYTVVKYLQKYVVKMSRRVGIMPSNRSMYYCTYIQTTQNKASGERETIPTGKKR